MPAVPAVKDPTGLIVAVPLGLIVTFPLGLIVALVVTDNVLNLPVAAVVEPMFILLMLPVTLGDIVTVPVGLSVTVPVGLSVIFPVPAKLTAPATFNPVSVPNILTTLDPKVVWLSSKLPDELTYDPGVSSRRDPVTVIVCVIKFPVESTTKYGLVYPLADLNSS
jgi:hypothetical protein